MPYGLHVRLPGFERSFSAAVQGVKDWIAEHSTSRDSGIG
ncbi:hypothetical protein Mal33_45560 [Rosistilla oblonga]|uniref:Uncharacterized protein n=1 Tax=Rosistilla oblonga TaxID=2527990 RepID=A0A518IZL7_9BACT|nr:hypothetical protein Mal33_45560 [Rosistilla oblonga]